MLLQYIKEDIDWRMSELASLKTIPMRYRMMDHHKEMLTKYAVPSIYSLWEGFVKKSFFNFITEINDLELEIKDVHINLVTHALSSLDKLSLENPRMNFNTKKEFVQYYQDINKEKFNIPVKLPTKSNIDFAVINDILERFNLSLLSKKDYQKRLQKLINFRNSISHGEISIPIKNKDLMEFSMLVNDLMFEVFSRIEDGINKKLYLSQIEE